MITHKILRRTAISVAFGGTVAALAGCSATVNIPVTVRGIIDDLVDALLSRAPPDLGAKLKALWQQLDAGGDWKATARAIVGVALEILALGVVPEPYASFARTALAGLSLFLGGSAPAATAMGIVGPGVMPVTLDEAAAAAAKLRGMPR